MESVVLVPTVGEDPDALLPFPTLSVFDSSRDKLSLNPHLVGKTRLPSNTEATCKLSLLQSRVPERQL